MRPFRYWLLLSLLPVLIVGGLVLYLPRDERQLLTSQSSWWSTGSVQAVIPGRTLVHSDEPPFHDGQEDALYWSAVPGVGDGSGRLVSVPFEAPLWITFSVAGDLTRPGNDVYLQLVGEDKHMRVSAQTHLQPTSRGMVFAWRRVTLALPAGWAGKRVQIVLEAGPRSKGDVIGVSNPRALTSGAVLVSHLRALAVLPACVVSLALFVLPGLPVAVRLAARGVVTPGRIMVATGIFCCLGGYLTFWAYFWRPIAGACLSGLSLLGGAALCVADCRRGRPTRSLLLSGDVGTPLALTALVALFYASLWQAVNLRTPVQLTPCLRFQEFVLNKDNVIPLLFADRLYTGNDPRGFLGNEWQSSDRPPLQAGIFLVQYPFWSFVTGRRAWSFVFGCVLQCLWVPAVWEFWQSAGLTRRRAGVALLFVVLTGFALVNSVFSWPKMLAGALTLNAISLALLPRETSLPYPLARAALWGLAAALGFLAHGGVAFTLLAFGAFLLWPRYFPGLRRLAIAASVFLLTVVPWSLYQSLYDPPGNKLLQEHLAGVTDPQRMSRPVWANLRDSYGSLSLKEIVANKWANVQVLFRASEHPSGDHFPWPPLGQPKPWPVDATSLRRCEFLCFFWAPALLNFGWLAAAVLAARRAAVLDQTLGFTAPAIALLSVVIWVLLMFGPGTTVTHQGSYATLLLLLASLAAWLTALPRWLQLALLAAQGIVFSLTWLFTSPANAYGLPNPFMIAAAALSFGLLCRVAVGRLHSDDGAKNRLEYETVHVAPSPESHAAV
jgi:hypothetical protein